MLSHHPRMQISFHVCSEAIQAGAKKTTLFEFPALAAAGQTDQPMHSQSTNFGKFKLSSLNLAAFFPLNPVFR